MPIHIPNLKQKNLKSKNVKLSTLAKKNPNFQLSAFQQIHKMRMNNRLLQTLERNDIERP